MSGLEVLVPMKPLATAKSRLAPVVPEMRRQAAALYMLRRVLDAGVGATGAEACRLVGGDEMVRRIAEQAGCRWVPEQGHDLNSSLWAAMQESVSRGSQAVLFLPADLPQATPSDVAAVVAASAGLAKPVGVVARNDGGTNALLVPAGLAFPPLLGVGSYVRHTDAVRSRGAVLVAADAPGLAVDVDTPEDLTWAEAHADGFSAGLELWTEWLAQQGERGFPLGGRGNDGRGGRG